MGLDPNLIERIAFYVFAAAALASSLVVVVHRNPVACAMALVMTFLAVAGLYLTLGATFLTAVQILVYAGAIMVLFLFVIMLLNLERDPFERPQVGRLAGAVMAVAMMFGMVTFLGTSAVPAADTSVRPGTGAEIGRSFFAEYLFPFEMASLLLLVAMIGAILIARRRPARQEEA